MGQCTVNNQAPSLRSDIQYFFEYVTFQGKSIPVPTAVGKASLYGNNKDGFLGKKTATGTPLRPNSKIGAIQAFPLARLWGRAPLQLNITRTDNQEKVKVAADDRGPFETKKHGNKCEFVAHSKRVIDLSFAAGKAIHFTSGIIEVNIQPELGTAWPPKNEKELAGWVARFPGFQTAAGKKIAEEFAKHFKESKLKTNPTTNPNGYYL